MPPPRLSRPRESTSRRSIGGETALDDRTKLQLIEPVGRQVRQMRQMAASPLGSTLTREATSCSGGKPVI
jgi:hypothetical protein